MHNTTNSIADTAWAAGFLDGEGCFTITRTRRKMKDGSKKSYYRVWVAAGQVDHLWQHQAVEKLHKMFGGYIIRSKSMSKTSPRCNTITWGIVAQEALACVKQIRPYSILKRRNIDLIIKFQEEAVGRKGQRDRKKLALQEGFFYEMRNYNSKNKLQLQRTKREDAEMRSNSLA